MILHCDMTLCVVRNRMLSSRHGAVVTVQQRCLSDASHHQQQQQSSDHNQLSLTNSCAQVSVIKS